MVKTCMYMYITVVKCKTEKINEVQRNLQIKVYNSCIPSMSLSVVNTSSGISIHCLWNQFLQASWSVLSTNACITCGISQVDGHLDMYKGKKYNFVDEYTLRH